MRNCAVTTITLLTFCLACARAGEFPLKYDSAKDSRFAEAARMGTRYAETPQNESDGLAGAPVGVTRHAFRARVDLGGGLSCALLLDPARVPAMYVDADEDGDFSDEAKVEGSIISNRPGMIRGTSAVLFGPVAVPCGNGDAKVEILVEVYDKSLVAAYPAGFMAGEVTLGSRKYDFAVVDASYDGRYDRRFTGPNESSDCVLIDLDRDGKFGDSTAGESCPLPRMIQVESEYYSLVVAPDGSSVTIDKAEPKLGSLGLPGTAYVTLMSESGLYSVSGSKGAAQLPVGKYSILGYGLSAGDESGTWTVEGSRGATMSEVEVVQDQPATLSIGDPLKARLSVQTSQEGVLIGLDGLEGQAGESYPPLARRNGSAMPPPRLSILDEARNVLATGAFQYG